MAMFNHNKDRVYIALYSRGNLSKCRYHWALIIGPKHEAGVSKAGYRHDAKQRFDPTMPKNCVWYHEVQKVPLKPVDMLLVRVMIGKVRNGARLSRLLDTVQVVQGDPAWNCRGWVKDAVEAIAKDGHCLCKPGVTDWSKIEQTVFEYITAKQKQRRFGRAQGIVSSSCDWDLDQVPTYDLVGQRELIA